MSGTSGTTHRGTSNMPSSPPPPYSYEPIPSSMKLPLPAMSQGTGRSSSWEWLVDMSVAHGWGIPGDIDAPLVKAPSYEMVSPDTANRTHAVRSSRPLSLVSSAHSLSTQPRRTSANSSRRTTRGTPVTPVQHNASLDHPTPPTSSPPLFSDSGSKPPTLHRPDSVNQVSQIQSSGLNSGADALAKRIHLLSKQTGVSEEDLAPECAKVKKTNCRWSSNNSALSACGNIVPMNELDFKEHILQHSRSTATGIKCKWVLSSGTCGKLVDPRIIVEHVKSHILLLVWSCRFCGFVKGTPEDIFKHYQHCKELMYRYGKHQQELETRTNKRVRRPDDPAGPRKKRRTVQ